MLGRKDQSYHLFNLHLLSTPKNKMNLYRQLSNFFFSNLSGHNATKTFKLALKYVCSLFGSFFGGNNF